VRALLVKIISPAYRRNGAHRSTIYGGGLLCPAKMKIKCQSDLLRDKSKQFAHCTLTRKYIITGLFRRQKSSAMPLHKNNIDKIDIKCKMCFNGQWEHAWKSQMQFFPYIRYGKKFVAFFPLHLTRKTPRTFWDNFFLISVLLNKTLRYFT